MIIVIAVTVVVTVVTYGATSELLRTELGAFGGAVAAGAVAGAAGSIAGQLTGNVVGTQQGFSWSIEAEFVPSTTAVNANAITASSNNGLRTSTVVSPERAQSFLIENGMTADRAADFVASFDGPITARLVQPGENFLRYTDVADSKGSFLTTTQFANPSEAVDGLYLGPYGNRATLVQPVTSVGRSIVLEGGVANGAPGVQQTLIVNRGVFQIGLGTGY